MRGAKQTIQLSAAALLVVAWLGSCSGGDGSATDASVGSDRARGQCSLCSTTDTCCDGLCIDTSQSLLNCGGCDSPCDSQVANRCSGGFCVCDFGAACSGGDICCDSGCKDLQTDARNCGACGNQCGENEACADGICVCAAAGALCEAGQTCCASGCSDTSMDSGNCGACDAACENLEFCADSACTCEFECPAPFPFGQHIVCCETGCFDLCSDVKHCGTCEDTDCNECSLGGCDGAPPDFLNCLISM